FGGLVVVTDFTAGAVGDVLSLNNVLSSLAGWDGSSNPFGAGLLRLTQSGDDTLLERFMPAPPPIGVDTWVTMAKLLGVDADTLTAGNFSPSYDPSGGAIAGATIDGGAGNDLLIGTSGDDSISGFAGFDTLRGGPGADVLDGGDDVDWLDGEAGADVLLGGLGNDQLSGGAGNDLLDGGEGDDSLSDGDGADTVLGGAGNDYLSSGMGSDLLVGGDGDDQFSLLDGGDTADGGAGNDQFFVMNASLAGHTVTTGAGSDTVVLQSFGGLVVVTDFTAGAVGDVLSLNNVLSSLAGWDGSSNPFGAGLLRLTQSGDDTLLERFMPAPPPIGVDTWVTMAKLLGVDADTLTAGNFSPLYDPDGSGVTGASVSGTIGDDNLAGSIGDDTISASSGNDTLSGGNGSDILVGGEGNDILTGGHGADVFHWSAGDDATVSGVAVDTLTDFDPTMNA